VKIVLLVSSSTPVHLVDHLSHSPYAAADSPLAPIEREAQENVKFPSTVHWVLKSWGDFSSTLSYAASCTYKESSFRFDWKITLIVDIL
jgi:hypothetical protein